MNQPLPVAKYPPGAASSWAKPTPQQFIAWIVRAKIKEASTLALRCWSALAEAQGHQQLRGQPLTFTGGAVTCPCRCDVVSWLHAHFLE